MSRPLQSETEQFRQDCGSIIAPFAAVPEFLRFETSTNGGTYYVKEDVEYGVSSAQTKAYNFTFSAGDYYEKENNNTKETATAIQTDKTSQILIQTTSGIARTFTK